MTKKMTKNLYVAIKVMIESGCSNVEIADHLKLSRITVSRVKTSESLEDYFQQMRAIQAKYDKKKREAKPEVTEKPVSTPQIVEHRQSVTVQATHYMESELKKQTEVLELISRKLTAQNELLEKLLDCWKDQ